MRIAALPLLFLAGCVTQPAPVAPPIDAARLQAITGFELGGRIGVSTPDDGFNGSLEWRQLGDEVYLSVHGALGMGRVEILGDAEGVEIRAADGTRRRYVDPAHALAEVYGWYLPVSALRYWVLGAPSPASRPLQVLEAESLGSPRLSRLVQDDWQIDYDEYRVYDGWVLPRKMVLEGDSVRVKLVVSKWRVDGPAPSAAGSVAGPAMPD